MADRYDVHPHHLLRAALEDQFAADVLRALEVRPDEMKVTLTERWLAASDVIEIEEIESVGVDVASVLEALNPAGVRPVEWGGRRLSAPARDVLVRALGIGAAMRHQQVSSGHLLLALLASKDAIVLQTLAAHRVRAKEVRPLVAQWGRRTI